jgi:hypothetical protein
MLWSRRISLLLLGLTLGTSAVTACKQDDPKPGYAGDGTPGGPVPIGSTEGGVDSAIATDGAVGDAGEAGVCSDITLTGVLVDRIAIAGDPPVSTGGTIVDGTYDLTLYQAYVGTSGVGGPTGLTARSSLRITAGKIDQIIETGGSTPTTTLVTRSTYNATGTTFASTELCPATGGGGQLQYTASDPSLILRDPVTKEEFTFAKR